MKQFDRIRVLLHEVQAAIRYTEFSLTLHAQQQMTSRYVRVSDIRDIILSAEAEIIEDYQDDPRGSSCLIFGKASGRVFHVHTSYPPEIVVITAYEPDPTKWEADFKTRK